MWRRVALGRTEVLEERIASIIRVRRISELETTLAVTSNCSNVLQLIATANTVPSYLILSTLMMEAIRSSEPSVLTRTTRHHIPKMTFFSVRWVASFQLIPFKTDNWANAWNWDLLLLLLPPFCDVKNTQSTSSGSAHFRLQTLLRSTARFIKETSLWKDFYFIFFTCEIYGFSRNAGISFRFPC
jgi:hypothetical protein